MRFRELLSESPSAPLYHNMTWKKARNCFNDDAMPARWRHNVPGVGDVWGNSFTRNIRYYMSGYNVQIVVDQARLRQTNRIMPLDGEQIFRRTLRLDRDDVEPDGPLLRVRGLPDRASENPLAEEFVVGEIKPLSRYITAINLSEPSLYGMTGAEVIEFLELAEHYAQHHGIKLNVSQEYIDRVEETKRSWAEDE